MQVHQPERRLIPGLNPEIADHDTASFFPFPLFSSDQLPPRKQAAAVATRRVLPQAPITHTHTGRWQAHQLNEDDVNITARVLCCAAVSSVANTEIETKMDDASSIHGEHARKNKRVQYQHSSYPSIRKSKKEKQKKHTMLSM